MSAIATPTYIYQMCSTDTQMRDLLTNFYTALESVGWTQSADTGQLNLSTISLATSFSPYLPYKIHYFNDSLHGTSPCYLKTSWSKYSTSYIGLSMAVMKSSSGDGELTYPFVSATPPSTTGNKNSLSTIRKTYAADRYSGLIYESLTNPATQNQIKQFSFFFGRTIDLDTGLSTADGWFFYLPTVVSNYPGRVAVCDNVNNTIDNNTAYCMVPGNQGNISPGVNMFRHWFPINNKYQMNPYAATVDSTVIRNGATFDASIAGSGFGEHTYRRMHDIGTAWSIRYANHALAMIWE